MLRIHNSAARPCSQGLAAGKQGTRFARLLWPAVRSPCGPPPNNVYSVHRGLKAFSVSVQKGDRRFFEFHSGKCGAMISNPKRVPGTFLRFTLKNAVLLFTIEKGCQARFCGTAQGAGRARDWRGARAATASAPGPER
jgi:hypothetical protein